MKKPFKHLKGAVFDALQILPRFVYSTNSVMPGRAVTEELCADLTRIFALLPCFGADFAAPDKFMVKPFRRVYAQEPVGAFLNA